MTCKTSRSWGWMESPLYSHCSIKWGDKVTEHSNYFDEHRLFVVPQASLRLKSIPNTTKCTTGVQRCRVRWIYFPRKIILQRPKTYNFFHQWVCHISHIPQVNHSCNAIQHYRKWSNKRRGRLLNLKVPRGAFKRERGVYSNNCNMIT